MSLLTAHLICATATWLALVTEGIPTRQLSLRSIRKSLRRDIVLFGPWRVLSWGLLCIVAWWLVWLGWLAEWIGDQQR